MVDKIENITVDRMNSRDNDKILRLFYRIENIMVLQQEVNYNYTEFKNVKEVLDYWRHLYKETQLSVQKRNEIIDKIKNTCLNMKT